MEEGTGRSPRRSRSVSLGGRLVAIAVLTSSSIAACGSPDGAATDLTGPLTALPACEEPGTALDEPPGDGVVLPDGARLLEQHEQGPIVSAAGYVDRTPIQVRLAYEAMDGRDGISLVSSEDEVFEAELLLDAGDRRVFVRATAACDRGSNLLVISAPADAGAEVPTPAGDGSVTE